MLRVSLLEAARAQVAAEQRVESGREAITEAIGYFHHIFLFHAELGGIDADEHQCAFHKATLGAEAAATIQADSGIEDLLVDLHAEFLPKAEEGSDGAVEVFVVVEVMDEFVVVRHVFLSSKGSQKAENLFSGVGKITAGIAFVQGFLQRYRCTHDGEKGVDALLVDGASIVRNTAGEGNDTATVGFGAFGNTAGGFAHSGLRIDAAFPGDGDISTFKRRVDAHSIEDEIHTRMKAGIQEGEEAEAQATSRTSSGIFPHVLAGEIGTDAGIRSHMGIRCFYIFQAFLRAIDSGRTTGAAEGIVHVAGDAEFGVLQFGHDIISRNGGHKRQGLCSAVDLSTGGITEGEAKGLEHTHAAIGSGRAADTHDEAAATLAQGMGYHFPNAVGAGGNAVPFFHGDEGQAGGCGHFHDGQPVFQAIVGQNGVFDDITLSLRDDRNEELGEIDEYN